MNSYMNSGVPRFQMSLFFSWKACPLPADRNNHENDQVQSTCASMELIFWNRLPIVAISLRLARAAVRVLLIFKLVLVMAGWLGVPRQTSNKSCHILLCRFGVSTAARALFISESLTLANLNGSRLGKTRSTSESWIVRSKIATDKLHSGHVFLFVAPGKCWAIINTLVRLS